VTLEGELLAAEEVVLAGADLKSVSTSLEVAGVAALLCGKDVEIEAVAGFDLANIVANPAVEGAAFEMPEICIVFSSIRTRTRRTTTIGRNHPIVQPIHRKSA